MLGNRVDCSGKFNLHKLRPCLLSHKVCPQRFEDPHSFVAMLIEVGLCQLIFRNAHRKTIFYYASIKYSLSKVLFGIIQC